MWIKVRMMVKVWAIVQTSARVIWLERPMLYRMLGRMATRETIKAAMLSICFPLCVMSW